MNRGFQINYNILFGIVFPIMISTKGLFMVPLTFVNNLSYGPIIFSVCGGEVNFEGEEQKKADFDKGGNKVWPKYGKGGRNYDFV